MALLVGGFFLGEPVWSPSGDDRMLPTLTYGEGGDVAELNRDSRDRCVNTPVQAGRPLGGSNWVDCDEPHDAELVSWYSTVGDGSLDTDVPAARYPGEETLRRYGEAACALMFHSNRVDDEQRGALAYRVLVPTRQEWERRPGDSLDDAVRDVLCFVSQDGGGRLDEQVRQDVW